MAGAGRAGRTNAPAFQGLLSFSPLAQHSYSGDEGQKYLTNDELRTAVPTCQALSQGAYTNGAGQCAWWLRSPGMTETSPAYYASGGSIGSRAHEVNETIIGVRPAMWVKMELEENADSSTAKELFDRAHSLDEEQMDGIWPEQSYL